MTFGAGSPQLLSCSIAKKKMPRWAIFFLVVGICGLEPQTSSLSVTRSNQLSYIPLSVFYQNL